MDINQEICKISVKKGKTLQLSQVSPIKDIVYFGQSLKEVKKSQSPSEQEHDHIQSISSIYKPVINVLRCVGVCPIHVEQTATGITYSFKLLSKISVINAVLSSVVVFFYMTWLSRSSPLEYAAKGKTNDSFESDNSNSFDCKSVFLPFLYKVLPMQLPINTTLNIIASLASIPKFVHLLGKWSRFERNFQTKLRSTKSPFDGLNRCRNRLALLYFLFGGVYCTLVILATRPRCTGHTTPCTSWKLAASVFVVFPYAMYTFLEDYKFLLMFRTMEKGFRQIFIVIKEHNEQTITNQVSRQSLAEILSKWHELLEDLRQQIRILSECSLYHHIVSMSTTFFSLLVGVYFSIVFQFTSAIDNEKGGLAFIAMGFCTIGFFRCLVKTNGCERILHEEKQVANQLRAVQTGEDFKTQLRINALVDLMGREPAQITILSCFKLNTSFLFQIVGQIATYLIVFLQFDKM